MKFFVFLEIIISEQILLLCSLEPFGLLWILWRLLWICGVRVVHLFWSFAESPNHRFWNAELPCVYGLSFIEVALRAKNQQHKNQRATTQDSRFLYRARSFSNVLIFPLGRKMNSETACMLKQSSNQVYQCYQRFKLSLFIKVNTYILPG